MSLPAIRCPSPALGRRVPCSPSSLQRRGAQVTLFESRPDHTAGAGESGRSINLALADRGIHALKLAGVFDEIRGALVPMRGRMVHRQDGSASLQPYGLRPREVIYSISRHRLNEALLRVAQRQPRVAVKFEHRLEDADFEARVAQVRDLRRGLDVRCRWALAGHRRRGLGDAPPHGRARPDRGARIRILSTATRNCLIPADAHGGFSDGSRGAAHLAARRLHADRAANDDGSFTATLFLPKHRH